MKKTIITMALIAMASMSNVYAKHNGTLVCTGMNIGDYKSHNIRWNLNTYKILQDGYVYKINSINDFDENVKQVLTENFVNQEGIYVRNEFYVVYKGKFNGDVYMVQRNIATSKALAFLELACYKED